jgi:hypothetical protein
MIPAAAVGSKAAKKGADIVQGMATQRVIGYTKSISYKKGKKTIQENLNVGIQAWELGAVLLGLGAYAYLTGDQTLTAGNLAGLVPAPPSDINNVGPPGSSWFSAAGKDLDKWLGSL